MRASYTVKGMEVASKKSDKARLKMKMFLAVLISFLLNTAHITSKFPNTKKIKYLKKLNNRFVFCTSIKIGLRHRVDFNGQQSFFIKYAHNLCERKATQ